MEPERFKAGDVIHLRDGSRAEVIAPSEDGSSVRARYLEDPGSPFLAGKEDLVAAELIAGFSPAPPGPEWGRRVVLFVHRVPESEESEGGYVAETMTGVPHGAILSSGEDDSPERALDRVVLALQAFGFSGSIGVEDASRVGGVRRYEVELP